LCHFILLDHVRFFGCASGCGVGERVDVVDVALMPNDVALAPVKEDPFVLSATWAVDIFEAVS